MINAPDPRVQLLQEILEHPDTHTAIHTAMEPRVGHGTWGSIDITANAALSLYTPIPCVAVTVTRDDESRAAVLADPPPELLRLNVVECVRGLLELMDGRTPAPITTPEEAP